MEPSGRRSTVDQAIIVHLRDGRIAEAWEIADSASIGAPL